MSVYRRLWIGGVLLSLLGCAKQLETGPPIDNPQALAARLRASTGPTAPYRLRFAWRYADEKGRLDGEGVVRYNPSDSLRLDLFAPGDASMSVALTPSGLSTLGEIESVRLPGPVFLYGMAGIFRPGQGPPSSGFRTADSDVLVFGEEDAALYVYVDGSRIVRIEERRGRRVQRRIEVTWDEVGEWPRSAAYRDFVESRRVRWDLTEATELGTGNAKEIYDLPHSM